MTRSWIHFTRGRFVRQARVGLGDLREEHLSRQGFAGPVAMLYRTDGPNEVVRFEGDYRPRQIDSADVVAPDASDPRGGWQTMLSNDDVAVSISRRREAMPYYYRDMEGDLLYFVHRGRGVIATEFGPISYEPGDVPAIARTWRQPLAGRRIAAAHPAVRARAGWPAYADRSDNAGGAGCRGLWLAKAG